MDFEDSKQLWQQFSSPLPGEYGIEATLTDETGKTIDTKTGTVTIEGSASSDDKKDKKKDEKNPDEDES